MSAVKQSFHNADYKDLVNQLQGRGGISGRSPDWSGPGVDCEVLKPGARGRRKGKVRIKVSLEFCPDEPDIAEIPASNQSEVSKSESLLNDIRKTMNHNV